MEAVKDSHEEAPSETEEKELSVFARYISERLLGIRSVGKSLAKRFVEELSEDEISMLLLRGEHDDLLRLKNLGERKAFRIVQSLCFDESIQEKAEKLRHTVFPSRKVAEEQVKRLESLLKYYKVSCETEDVHSFDETWQPIGCRVIALRLSMDEEGAALAKEADLKRSLEKPKVMVPILKTPEGKKPPLPPPKVDVKIGRPTLRDDGVQMPFILSLRFREEEAAYIEAFKEAVDRSGHTLTRVMRDLLEAALQTFSDHEIMQECAKTSASGDRYVFRITDQRNLLLDGMAGRFSQELGIRVYKVDVAARAVIMMAQRKFEELALRTGVDIPQSPLGIADLRYGKKATSEEDEEDGA